MMIFAIILLFVFYLTYRWWSQRDLPPGPFGLPLVGYLPFLNPKAPHVSLTNLAEKYGNIYGLRLGSLYTVVLTDPVLISSVFSKDSATGRAPLYVTHGIMGGYGIICAEGTMWRIHRKFTAKCLRLFGATKGYSAKTQSLEKIIVDQVQDCVQAIKDDVSMDPEKCLQHSVGSIMCHLVFGKTWSRDDETWKWLQALQEVGTKAIGVAGPLNFLPFLRFVPMYKKVMRFLLDGKHKTHRIYEELIEMQKKSYDAKCENPENVIQAFLRELDTTNDVEYFTNAQFYHLLGDVFGAGLDTTLTTLRWFFLYMAAYPEVQARIREELNAAIQERLPSLEHLPSVPLTQAAIAETQRIRSVVPVGIPHATVEHLRIVNYRIPKGTMIIPLQWAVHMNPANWSNPTDFNPNRFLTDEGTFFKPKEFIPFQTGKRMCVGEDLANMILFLFASTVLQRFEISADSVDLDGEIGITLTPKHQVLHFKPLV